MRFIMFSRWLMKILTRCCNLLNIYSRQLIMILNVINDNFQVYILIQIMVIVYHVYLNTKIHVYLNTIKWSIDMYVYLNT
jgi:hypothetical protein